MPSHVSTSLADLFAATDASAPVRMRGHSARLLCRLDPEEHARRTGAAGRRLALADWAPLNLLMGLPHGEPVPVAALSIRERTILPRLPHWTHTLHDGHIRRSARPPLHPVYAAIFASRWEEGRAAAREFRPFSAPVVVLDALDDPFAPIEAEGLGIGLALDEKLVVAPARRVPSPGPTLWWLAEHAYARY
ncbi:hypothetical protein Afil01_13210 [Actinorhabdospora filicis]|uniref:Uncharacterized protein n=1 Tax=Actinorhabdospora filicis TaxID=1785913 RepID=A0A9W6SG37_9ACTN|nr:hypothetical protein [Actinorhabdospora filicis]GLZ76514.1 hypothetical protein Afil01_13210 [Actinorhabdospora filicis]